MAVVDADHGSLEGGLDGLTPQSIIDDIVNEEPQDKTAPIDNVVEEEMWLPPGGDLLPITKAKPHGDAVHISATQSLEEEAMVWLESHAHVEAAMLDDLNDGSVQQSGSLAMDGSSMMKMAMKLNAHKAAAKALTLARQERASLAMQITKVDQAIDSSIKHYGKQFGTIHGKHSVAVALKQEFHRKARYSENTQQRIMMETNTRKFCALPWFRKLALHNGDLCGDLRRKYAAEGKVLRIGFGRPGEKQTPSTVPKSWSKHRTHRRHAARALRYAHRRSHRRHHRRHVRRPGSSMPHSWEHTSVRQTRRALAMLKRNFPHHRSKEARHKARRWRERN